MSTFVRKSEEEILMKNIIKNNEHLTKLFQDLKKNRKKTYLQQEKLKNTHTHAEVVILQNNDTEDNIA